MTIATLASSTQPALAQPSSWTIQTADPLPSSGWSTSLRLDAAGRPHVSEWKPGTNVRYAVFDGSSWSVETIPIPATFGPIEDPAGARGSVPSGVRTGADPAQTTLLITVATALALDPSGDPWIAYIKTDEHNSVAPPTPVHVSHRTGGSWVTEDLELGVYTPSVDVDDVGRVHVCYLAGTPANNILRHAVRDGGSWSYETIDANGGRAELRLDRQGVPHVVYYDGARGVLVHAVRGGAVWDTTTVPTPHVPASFAFALNPAGQARVAVADYAVAYQTTLQYLEQQGASWLVSTAEPSTSLKVELSLALDPAGNPVIAYNDQNGLDLKVASRQGGLWTSTIVDGEGNTGYYSSVAVHPGGYPIVSYYTAEGGGMRVATGTATVAVGAGAVPAAFRIVGPQPNPARVGTPIALSLELPSAGRVQLEAFDVSGRRIASRLLEGLGAGRTSVSWNPAFHAPGVFLLRASTSTGQSVSKRCAVVR